MRSEPNSAWHENAIRAWQLAILRYALTLDGGDRTNVMTLAATIDALGREAKCAAEFSFFRRTSKEFCDAIVQADEPHADVFSRFLARIDDARLKRAFAAVVQRDWPERLSLHEPRKPRPDLWRGLSQRQKDKV